MRYLTGVAHVCVADADGSNPECSDDCPACHFPGHACPVAPGECDLCAPEPAEDRESYEQSHRRDLLERAWDAGYNAAIGDTQFGIETQTPNPFARRDS